MHANKQVCDLLLDQEKDKKYLHDKLTQAYMKIQRLHDTLSAKNTCLADNIEQLSKHLKFVHNQLDIVSNGGIIDKNLLMILISEHGLT